VSAATHARRRRSAQWFGVALLAFGVTLPGSAARARPLCTVHAAVDPATAVVGEQVIHRTWIERAEGVDRIEWLRSPSFRGARNERLPGEVEKRIDAGDGPPRFVRVEARAIFPAHSGELVVGEGAIRCIAPDEVGSTFHQDVALPALRLVVSALPEAGRPEEHAGLVGRVQLSLATERASLRVGESVALQLTTRGAANLWALPSPFADLALPGGAEIFEEAPELELGPGKRLSVRRWDRAVLVPREPGRIEIPALRAVYYDPETRAYGVSTSEPVVLDVRARATAGDLGSTPLEATTTRRIASESFFGPERRGLRWIVPTLGVALLALVALGWPLYDARRRRWWPAEQALAGARRAVDSGDPHAAVGASERAIRAILEVMAPPLAGLPGEELARHAAGDDLLTRLARTLAALDAERFGKSTPLPDPDAVAELLAAARARKD